jgi:hypothetical protein
MSTLQAWPCPRAPGPDRCRARDGHVPRARTIRVGEPGGSGLSCYAPAPSRRPCPRSTRCSGATSWLPCSLPGHARPPSGVREVPNDLWQIDATEVRLRSPKEGLVLDTIDYPSQRNQMWLSMRTAAVNLRRLINLGLNHSGSCSLIPALSQRRPAGHRIAAIRRASAEAFHAVGEPRMLFLQRSPQARAARPLPQPSAFPRREMRKLWV